MRIAVFILAAALANPVVAASRERIAIINIGATSLVTYLSCVVQKKARPRVCLAAGAVAGAGFYQAKRYAANGDITTGWLLANLSTSIVENTAAGEHPLSRLGYTFGPFRLRVTTPADVRRESWVDLDLSAVETGFLVRAIQDADDIDIRDGLLWYETRHPERRDGLVYHGYTWGIYPGTWTRADDSTWSHEAVHAIQALQLDSVEPPLLTIDRTRKRIRLRHLKAGAFNLTDNLYWGQRNYEERWGEIEAYRLVDDEPPPR